MRKSGKHVENARKQVEARSYKLGEAAELLKKLHHTKFNETVELAINLGVDPKHSDQVVRGTVGLPNGLGKAVRVLVIAGGEKVREAQEAGADFVGGEDVVQKIMEGWTDFDAVIATPDMMRSAGKLGKVLGPRGLMPNPKTGTVTFEVAKAIKEVKAGKVEFRVDKAGIVHCPIGKIQFESAKLAENAHAVIEAVVKAKPAEQNDEEAQRKTAGPRQAQDRACQSINRHSLDLPGHHRRSRHQAPPRRTGCGRQIQGCKEHASGARRRRHAGGELAQESERHEFHRLHRSRPGRAGEGAH